MGYRKRIQFRHDEQIRRKMDLDGRLQQPQATAVLGSFDHLNQFDLFRKSRVLSNRYIIIGYLKLPPEFFCQK